MELSAVTDLPPPSAEDESLILFLGSYEGPLDLLLGLARQKRVDLKHISIAALAQQYLDFVAQAKRLHLAVKAEYLVMATHLARMKARLLLPRDKVESAQGERSEAALRESLLWLENARQTARFLRTLPRLGAEIFACGAAHKTLPDSVVEWELDANLFELLQSYVAIERRCNRQAKRLRIRALRLYDLQDARSTLKAQLDEQWRDLLRLIPAAVYRQAEKEENPKLFLKSVVSGFFSAALEISTNNRNAPKTLPPSQSRKDGQPSSEERPADSKDREAYAERAYAELYQPSPESPLQLRLRSERPSFAPPGLASPGLAPSALAPSGVAPPGLAPPGLAPSDRSRV